MTGGAHRMKWYVYAGGHGQPLQKIRHAATMRGSWPGYDVECSCGWETRTGGAVKSYIDKEVWYHKWQAANGYLTPRCGSCNGLCNWSDDAWVCIVCGDEWYADHGAEYAEPGMVEATQ